MRIGRIDKYLKRHQLKASIKKYLANGSKGMAGFTLHPDKAYMEISMQLYNRTPHPQIFLWWANPDVKVTDEDDPYIELMCGVYTDNQPDFSWLHPYEEKSFQQYFTPYRELGLVKMGLGNE